MGPKLPYAEETHAAKYRQEGESFEQAMRRVASTLADTQEHEEALRDILLDQRFLPAGRVQCAIGATRRTTAYNCFVSGTIPDDMDGIMRAAAHAAETMRRGGGIGYDFSTIRPKGDRISTLESQASGPVSFMDIFNSVCGTICSAGHRRGAQMGVLRVDHPDIMEFIHAKTNGHRLTNFNISIGVTDEFMEAVSNDTEFALRWGGKVYRTVRARDLWDAVMQNTWDWAEPGVLFIDRINGDNNLYYLEHIAATNPCGEQPLPPYGACLLGSFNLVKYTHKNRAGNGFYFDWPQFNEDIPHVVRAMDNVIDNTLYPLKEQEMEAKYKRRMGLGVTGVANCIEALGFSYGSEEFVNTLDGILHVLVRKAYKASADLAKEKGAFPGYDEEKYLESRFVQRLGTDIIKHIRRCGGVRNSHLTSIAPTGTISLCADNVSSGIEPVFAYDMSRTIQTPEGPKVIDLTDYAYREWGIEGKTSDQVTVEEHVAVLNKASHWVDSAVSKTCNVGDNVTFSEFKQVYMNAWKGGAKGCTTFRAAGKRYGILNAKPRSEENEGAACYIDPETGLRSCE